MTSASILHPLFPNVRRSPYFAATVSAGATAFMVYNHMYMPIDYGRDPAAEYDALVNGATLWDVAAERQTAITGPDALRLADYVATRDLSTIDPGQCRFTLVCDPDGRIMTEPIVLRPFADTVWISHGDVDLTLWVRGLAMGGGFDVDVFEPDVSPMQLQGPLSVEVIADLAPEAVDLAFYRNVVAEIAGVRCLVSRTGWSGELGYELYPLAVDRACDVWNAVAESGASRDLLITGPNLSRALERGITDTHYFVNSGMNPYEAGQARLVDLDHGPFVGQDALRVALEEGVRRTTVGLVCEPDVELPPLGSFWSVVDASGASVGLVRWAAHSYALERAAAIALLDYSLPVGTEVRIHYPDGDAAARVADLPLVG
jgi:aminomethyltransferase